MRATLFHNPTAGKGEHSKDHLLALLELAGFEVDYCSTKDKDFADRLSQPVEMAVIAGGDGTVRKVLTQLPDQEGPVGILPVGTANNIATSLGIGDDLQAVVNGWRSGKTTPFDIGIARGPWGERRFVEAVGYGALAMATDEKIGKDEEGEKRLLVGRAAFRKALADAEAMTLKLTIDGKTREEEALAVEVVNTGYTGPRLPLCPKAEPGDGKLNVVIVRPKNRAAMMEWLAEPDEADPPVETAPCRTVSFHWADRRPLRIDDKFPERSGSDKDRQVEAGLEDRGIRILRPAA